MNVHVPVLLKEVIEELKIKEDGVYLDVTGGLGGHSSEILKHLSQNGKLVVCDYNVDAVKGLQEKFSGDERVTVLSSRFSQVFEKTDLSFDGILADFGISSKQLGDDQLGIGFQVESPLDMRVDSRAELTAADLLKTQSEEELADIFYKYGGETAARRIARAIVYDRKNRIYYTTTSELRDFCSRIVGKYYKDRKIHPATKVFQALRIAVNNELGEVKDFIEVAPSKLNPEGRLVVISFHSGEDRLVKSSFRELSYKDSFSRPIKKAIRPEREEVLENSRARSAKMRVLEKKAT